MAPEALRGVCTSKSDVCVLTGTLTFKMLYYFLANVFYILSQLVVWSGALGNYNAR